jgi:glycosyltransferase involved in cell wall biosynthesis
MAAKILFYTHALVDGGAERLWARLASAFKERGFEVIFAQDFEADDNRGNLDASIPVHTLGRNHWRAARNLADLLRNEKPDIALSAVGGSNLKLLLAKTLARSNVCTIISYHGFNEWRSGLMSFATYLGLPVFSAYADRAVAVSGALRQTLVRRWRARSDRTVALLNPVYFPPDARVPSESELKARTDMVLAVGRLVPEKDFATLIRAFALLNRPNAKLIILGKGPEETKLRAEIAKLGLADRVLLPGFSKEPWHYYETAKCFALSSKSESFGNVIVEALAYGLPVVATACAGAKEILEDGRYGKLVPISDERQLAIAMANALDAPRDPAIRRKRADEFSFNRRVEDYFALVRQVLNGHEPAGVKVSDAPSREATRRV